LYCVTAKITGVEYFEPIEIGSLVTVRGEIMKVGKTSMTIHLEVNQENMYTGEIILTNRADFIMVALDAQGRSTPVKQLE
jgi:acyl-CoA hydrolase